MCMVFSKYRRVTSGENIKIQGSWAAASSPVSCASIRGACVPVSRLDYVSGFAHDTAEVNTLKEGWYGRWDDDVPLGTIDLWRHGGHSSAHCSWAGTGRSSRIRPLRSVISCLN